MIEMIFGSLAVIILFFVATAKKWTIANLFGYVVLFLFLIMLFIFNSFPKKPYSTNKK